MSEQVLTMTGIEAPQVKKAPGASFQARATKNASSARSRWRRSESWEYKLLFAVTFAVFLVAAAIESLNPRRLMARAAGSGEPSNNERQTIIQRASLGAKTCVAYAFMG